MAQPITITLAIKGYKVYPNLSTNWLKNGQKWAHFRTWSLRIGLWAILVYPKNSKTMAQPISILSTVFELLVAVTNPSAALLYFDEKQNVNVNVIILMYAG